MFELAGQWIGISDDGTHYRVDVDLRDGGFVGRVSSLNFIDINGDEEGLWSWSLLEAKIDESSAQIKIAGRIEKPSIHKRNGDALTEEEFSTLKSRIPDFSLPTHTEFEAIFNDGMLKAEWVSYHQFGEIKESLQLTKCQNVVSTLEPEEMTWDEFKQCVLIQGDGWVYRGQAENRRLKTSFHRTGRSDVINYMDIEAVELERYMNIYTDHLYDVNDDRSLGALLNLAQHHGYPTPLLDWTRSPFVAAFFAFENKRSVQTQERVIIFFFNEKEWSGMAGRFAPIRTPAMIVRTLDLQGYGNSRVIPQQALTMYSNVDDIEGLIQKNETFLGEYLKAVSLPAKSREDVMKELALMGITWGSLFPGLDGICKQLQRSHFEI